MSTDSCAESCEVDVPELQAWYTGVVSGEDLRNAMAVSGSNISRGTFGRIVADHLPSANDSKSGD